MSSPYPVLDNRPIDQWKVTELKEELKKRKLTTRGLKDDLIRRLDESIRNERKEAEENANNVSGCVSQSENDSQTENQPEDVTVVPTEIKNNSIDYGDNGNEKIESDVSQVDGGGSQGDEKFPEREAVNVSNPVLDEAEGDAVQLDVGDNQGNDKCPEGDVANASKPLLVEAGVDMVQIDVSGNQDNKKFSEGEITNASNSVLVEVEPALRANSPETSVVVAESVVSEVASSGLVLHGNEMLIEVGDSKSMPENEDPKVTHENFSVNTSETGSQLPEVNVVLGETLKSDSTCTDSVSINENNKLEDNLITDDVKLDLDLNPDLAQPSPRNVVPDGGKSHPMDVEEPSESKVSVTGKEHIDAENPDVVEKSEIGYMGPSEKLNLDRSSGDDSMEEDIMDNKQIDSKFSSDEVQDKGKKTLVPLEEKGLSKSVIEDPAKSVKNVDGEKKNSAEPSVKRKVHEPEAVVNAEPLKRQRLWNSEGLKVSESQRATSITTTTTPKGTFQPTTKPTVSRSNSTVSDEVQKERVVPPSSKPPTNSLRIDNFLRPFTLKAVQELLGRTGSVTSFWMDHIKTHCYVSYSSVGEAVETRNAVYNLQWPSNGGRLLVAEFVDPQEVKIRVEAPPQSPATPASAGPTLPVAPPVTHPQPSPRQPVQRQQLPPPPSLPPPPPPQLSNPPPVKERLPLPPPPPLPEKVDPPIVTLDDLFRKTKATPRIYFLPLSEEQVTARLKSQGKHVQSAGVARGRELFLARWCRSWFIDGFGFLQGLLWVEAEIK